MRGLTMGQKLKPETKRMKPMAYWFLVILLLGSAAPRVDTKQQVEDKKEQKEYNQRIETRLNQIYDMLETDRMNRNHPWN
jgi:hypothetical protein